MTSLYEFGIGHNIPTPNKIYFVGWRNLCRRKFAPPACCRFAFPLCCAPACCRCSCLRRRLPAALPAVPLRLPACRSPALRFRLPSCCLPALCFAALPAALPAALLLLRCALPAAAPLRVSALLRLPPALPLFRRSAAPLGRFRYLYTFAAFRPLICCLLCLLSCAFPFPAPPLCFACFAASIRGRAACSASLLRACRRFRAACFCRAAPPPASPPAFAAFAAVLPAAVLFPCLPSCRAACRLLRLLPRPCCRLCSALLPAFVFAVPALCLCLLCLPALLLPACCFAACRFVPAVPRAFVLCAFPLFSKGAPRACFAASFAFCRAFVLRLVSLYLRAASRAL